MLRGLYEKIYFYSKWIVSHVRKSCLLDFLSALSVKAKVPPLHTSSHPLPLSPISSPLLLVGVGTLAMGAATTTLGTSSSLPLPPLLSPFLPLPSSLLGLGMESGWGQHGRRRQR